MEEEMKGVVPGREPSVRHNVTAQIPYETSPMDSAAGRYPVPVRFATVQNLVVHPKLLKLLLVVAAGMVARYPDRSISTPHRHRSSDKRPGSYPHSDDTEPL